MPVSARTAPANLERRELHLALFACLASLIFAIGAALLMYPLVYYDGTHHADCAPRTAFLGFCALSVLCQRKVEMSGFLPSRNVRFLQG
jgi:hypothetical protein